jgi:hypothetical protein
VELEQQYKAIEASLVEGMSFAAILKTAAAKFGISERQVERDIAEVRRRWSLTAAAQRSKEELAAHFALAMYRRDMLFNASFKEKQYGVSLAAEKDRCTLLGLYEPTVVTLNMSNVDGLATLQSQLLKKLEALPTDKETEK